MKGFLAITTFYTYKTCDRELMIKFSESTEVREYKHINFPRTMFRLKPFSELKDPEKFDDKILIGKQFLMFNLFFVSQKQLRETYYKFETKYLNYYLTM